MSRQLTFIDLFAGVGGFRRGMELAGHKCVGFCEWDKYATMSYTAMHLVTEEQLHKLQSIGNMRERQKEISKGEYKNGEWYSNDIRSVDADSVPRCDVWCFGAPCQDFSIAGNRAGLDGDRSSLVREVFRIIRELKEEDRPEWLIYENVKGMLSSNHGWDFACILVEMESLGYNIEYQLFNSKDYGVPQNRERVYTIGHLRRCGRQKILPITGNNAEVSINQVMQYNTEVRKNTNRYRVYDDNGLAPCLGCMEGGGLEPHIIKCVGNINPSGKGMNGNVFVANGLSPTLTTNKGEGNKIAIGRINSSQDGIVSSLHGISQYLSAGHGNMPKIAIPVLTPDRLEKRQNGRRFKEDGEPMFTLTAQDRHGVAIGGIYTNDSERFRKGILKNTSRCLKANKHDACVAIMVSKRTEYGKQVRKQYENGEIKESRHNMTKLEPRTDGISNTITTVKKDNYLAIMIDTDSKQPGIYVQFSNGVVAYAVWYEKYQSYIVIRKLTPKECFRLQGWNDDYFDKAALVNSDSQLYKQAGNGVTVNVVYEIAKRLRSYEN